MGGQGLGCEEEQFSKSQGPMSSLRAGWDGLPGERRANSAAGGSTMALPSWSPWALVLGKAKGVQRDALALKGHRAPVRVV